MGEERRGRMMTLDELFRQREVEVRARLAAEDAYRQTPEGRAEYEAREAHHKRMREADERAWASRTPHQKGVDAFLSDEEREPPEELEKADRKEWLRGYDEEREAQGEDEE